MDPPLIMPFAVSNQIDLYRETLRANQQTKNAHSAVNSSPSIICDGEEDKAAGGCLDQFSFKTSRGYLVLEGVDEDAEDADATMRDELIMMARHDPIWEEELRRYLQTEEKERVQMQKDRAARFSHWREGVAVQPT